MEKKKLQQLQRVTSRPGEGATLTGVRIEKGAAGESSLVMNLLTAPVPERRYVADTGAVLRSPGGLRLVFAQAKLGGAPSGIAVLRSAVDIQMSDRAIGEFLASLVDVQDSLSKAEAKIQAFPLMEQFEEPPHVAGLTANLAPMAFNGEECCMDFYQMSPFVRNAIKDGGEISVEPVVRVTLPTGLMMGMLNKIRRTRQEQGSSK